MNDNSVHGVRFSGNDQFTIAAINSFQLLVIRFYPYVQGISSIIRYPFSNFYVYSLNVFSDNNSVSYPKRYRFLYVGEDMKTQDVVLVYTIVSVSANGMYKNCHKKLAQK